MLAAENALQDLKRPKPELWSVAVFLVSASLLLTASLVLQPVILLPTTAFLLMGWLTRSLATELCKDLCAGRN